MLALFVIIALVHASQATQLSVIGVNTNPGEDCDDVEDIRRVAIYDGCVPADGSSSSQLSCSDDGIEITASSYDDSNTCDGNITATDFIAAPTTCSDSSPRAKRALNPQSNGVLEQRYCGMPEFLSKANPTFPYATELFLDAECTVRSLTYIMDIQCMVNQEDPSTSSRFIYSDNKVIRRFFPQSTTCNGEQRQDIVMVPEVCTAIPNSDAYVKAHYSEGQSLTSAVRRFDSNSSVHVIIPSVVGVMLMMATYMLG